jgi:hypothetical protein
MPARRLAPLRNPELAHSCVHVLVHKFTQLDVLLAQRAGCKHKQRAAALTPQLLRTTADMVAGCMLDQLAAFTYMVGTQAGCP